MGTRVALIVIFNHKYDKNIPVLEEIYGKRFSTIFYLVPFYTGDRKDVIPVYDNSFYFQGYIAQALKSFYHADFEHYFFISDDLILNPDINENNYKQYLKLGDRSSFIPLLVSLHECGPWPRIREAYEYSVTCEGVEASNELPGADQALQLLNGHGISTGSIAFERLYEPSEDHTLKQKARSWYRRSKDWLAGNKRVLKYPLAGSYADIFVVAAHVVKQFSHYCGIFAATGLHVELAIPTALAFSTDDLVSEKDLDLRRRLMWSAQDLAELDKYNYSLDNLLDNFPASYLYLHPVKISKWHFNSREAVPPEHNVNES